MEKWVRVSKKTGNLYNLLRQENGIYTRLETNIKKLKALQSEFIASIMQVPKLEKIVLNEELGMQLEIKVD